MVWCQSMTDMRDNHPLMPLPHPAIEDCIPGSALCCRMPQSVADTISARKRIRPTSTSTDVSHLLLDKVGLWWRAYPRHPRLHQYHCRATASFDNYYSINHDHDNKWFPSSSLRSSLVPTHPIVVGDLIISHWLSSHIIPHYPYHPVCTIWHPHTSCCAQPSTPNSSLIAADGCASCQLVRCRSNLLQFWRIGLLPCVDGDLVL